MEKVITGYMLYSLVPVLDRGYYVDLERSITIYICVFFNACIILLMGYRHCKQLSLIRNRTVLDKAENKGKAERKAPDASWDSPYIDNRDPYRD